MVSSTTIRRSKKAKHIIDGCCISMALLAGIALLNAEARTGQHLAISTDVEKRDGQDHVRLDWDLQSASRDDAHGDWNTYLLNQIVTNGWIKIEWIADLPSLSMAGFIVIYNWHGILLPVRVDGFGIVTMPSNFIVRIISIRLHVSILI